MYDDTPRSASRILNGYATQSAFRASGRVTSEDTGERRPKVKSASTSTPAGSSSQGKGKGRASDSAPASNADSKDPKGKGKGKGAYDVPSILPHESLGEYNRRVESLMRPDVNKAIKDAASIKAAELAQVWKDKKERKKRAKLEKLVKEGKLDKSALDTVASSSKRKRAGGDDDGVDSDDGEAGGSAAPGAVKSRGIKEFAPLPGPKRLNDIVMAPPSLPHLRKLGQEKSVGKGVYGAIGSGSGKNPLNAGQQRILDEERERVVKLYREMKEKGIVGKGVEVGKAQ